MKTSANKPVVSLTSLLDDAEGCRIALEQANQAHLDSLQAVAEATCPYKVGQIVKTNRGLGVNGLKITGIVPPRFYNREHNQWAVETLSFSKSGELTKRPASFCHIDTLPSDAQPLTVEVVK